MNPNRWLQDSKFISRVIFPDLMYFENLCSTLSSYLRKIPIPVLTSWDWKHRKIYFKFWKHKRAFRVSSSLAITDFMFMVDEWLFSFFPHYKCLVLSDLSRDLDESVNLAVERNFSLQEVMRYPTILESGTITRIYSGKDQFKLLIQRGEKRITELRCSRIPVNSLKKELVNLRIQSMPEEILKDYIFNNSFSILETEDPTLVEVRYPEFQLINFFILHRSYLLEKIPEIIDVLTIRYGKYIIKFEDIEQKQHCLKVLSEKITEFIYNDEDLPQTDSTDLEK